MSAGAARRSSDHPGAAASTAGCRPGPSLAACMGHRSSQPDARHREHHETAIMTTRPLRMSSSGSAGSLAAVGG
jgi:hypothetical protein